MKKGKVITALVITGIGVAGYFMFKKPKFKVTDVSIKEGGDPVKKYNIKVGMKNHVIELTQNTNEQTELNYPLFKFNITSNADNLDEDGFPVLNMVISNKITKDKKEYIVKQGLKG